VTEIFRLVFYILCWQMMQGVGHRSWLTSRAVPITQAVRVDRSWSSCFIFERAYLNILKIC